MRNDSAGSGLPGHLAGPFHGAVQLFSSITFGLVVLGLILAYASLLSALPQWRGVVEMTEMQVFRHWTFSVLIVLFCINLSVVTWRRILHLGLADLLNPIAVLRRVTWLNLGVLVTHTGLLIFAVGSVWYFATKVEGDVALRSARLELVNLADPNRGAIDALPVETGRVWGQTMPAFGGGIAFRVMEVRHDAMNAPQEVVVRARVGETPAQTVTLTSDRDVQAISDRLALRLVVFPPEETFCDHELAALFINKLGDEQRAAHALHELPVHRERYLDEGSVLRERGTGARSPSKRAWSTAPWLEHWRLPIDIDSAKLPFSVQVTGYLPYIGDIAYRAIPGPKDGPPNPAINYTIRAPNVDINEPLLALEPANSLSRRAPIEFRWVQSAAERDALFAQLAGPHELAIELKEPPLRRTLAVHEGQEITLEGTPYKLTVESFLSTWEMASPELAGAVSPVATVRVETPDKKYRRTVVQRFPAYSQDVDDSGVRHRDGPYDANLTLRYRTADGGWFMVAAGPNLTPELGVFMPDGRVQRWPLAINQDVPLGGGATFVLREFIENARVMLEPLVEPVALRRPNVGRQASAIRIKLTGKGERANWSESRWVLFSQYPHINWPPYLPLRPTVVQLPGSAEQWEFVYSRQPHDLEAALVPGKLTVEFFPGRNSVSEWRSDFTVMERGAEPRAGAVWTNQTHNVGRWTLFQSGADSDHWAYTILGVGNRRGMWPMVIGCVLVTLGSLYAFYVKPFIKRARQQRAQARGSNGQPVEAGRARGELEPAVALHARQVVESRS